MKKKHIAPALSAVLLVLAISGCLLQTEKQGKRDSVPAKQVGIYGVLVDTSGKRIKDAQVTAIEAGRFSLPASAQTDADTVLTDSSGRYSFPDLAPGRYNLIGEYALGRLTAYVSGVDYAGSGTGVDVGEDTLRASGSVGGRVITAGAGKEGVIGYIPGTSYSSFTDENGEFLISGVPQGTYTVGYLIQGFQAAPDSGIRVQAGRVTRIPDKELGQDTASAPPAPTGLKAEYDPLHGVVRLDWSPIRVTDLLGYTVYRDSGGLSTPIAVTRETVADTFFLDTLRLDDWGDGGTRSLTYRVRSMDKGKNSSITYSRAVTIAVVRPPSTDTMALSLTLQGAIGDSTSIGDSVRCILGYTGSSRNLRQLAWRVDGDGDDDDVPVRQVQLASHPGQDTLVLSWISIGPHIIRVTVSDDMGNRWDLKRAIHVVRDRPKAHAGSDTLVFLGATVNLHGRGSDTFGRIVKWEWNVLGGGLFQPSADGEFTFAAPNYRQVVTCILRVTDDDGFSGFDTVKVTVTQTRPIAAAGPDQTISIGDSIYLVSLSSSPTGSLIRWEWDLDGSGEFKDSGTSVRFNAPMTPADSIPCVLRVTNDLGLSALDTLYITVLADPPVAGASATPPEVRAGGTFVLSPVSTTKGSGRIIKWEWDIGNTGRFVPGSAQDTLIMAGNTPDSNFRCVLRVTDDDGLTSTFSLRVPIRAGSGWIKWSENDGSPRKHMNNVRSGSALGKTWLYGGYFRPDVDMNFVGLFASSDMLSWDRMELSFTPEFTNRTLFSELFEFKNKVWFFCWNSDNGAVELWSSGDGADWSLVSAPAGLADRGEFSTVVFNGRIWAIAGVDTFDATFKEDAWYTEDGVTWKQATAKGGFGPRAGAGIAVGNGRLWILGGYGQGSQRPLFNDLWSSADGASWTRSAGAALPPRKGERDFIGRDGSFWIIQYGDVFNGNGSSETWTSQDGLAWSRQPGPQFTPTYNAKVFELNGSLWMISGEIGGNAVSEIWQTP